MAEDKRWIWAASLILVAAAGWYLVADGDEGPLQPEVYQSGLTDDRVSTSQDSSASVAEQQQQHDGNRVVVGAQLDERSRVSVALPSVGPPTTAVGDTANSDDILGEFEVPEGAPFPVSASIDRKCASYEDSVEIGCSEVREMLKRIEVEQSDPQWAKQMESKILAVAKTMVGYRVRALACRQTVCIVEMESSLGIVLGSHWRLLRQDLLTGDKIFGYEESANGRQTVTLSTFERR
jgi:hypothetical protein